MRWLLVVCLFALAGCGDLEGEIQSYRDQACKCPTLAPDKQRPCKDRALAQWNDISRRYGKVQGDTERMKALNEEARVCLSQIP